MHNSLIGCAVHTTLPRPHQDNSKVSSHALHTVFHTDHNTSLYIIRCSFFLQQILSMHFIPGAIIFLSFAISFLQLAT